MLARPPSPIKKKVWDVNVLAIYLVEDHPGHSYVAPVVERGLRGEYIPVILDILPVRVYWVMERKWGINREEARAAVLDFLGGHEVLRIAPLRRETMVEAFKLAEELGHDVYDCIYVALARQEGAESIVTTDTDFEELCGKVGLEYENPVPLSVLRRFKKLRVRAQGVSRMIDEKCEE